MSVQNSENESRNVANGHRRIFENNTSVQPRPDYADKQSSPPETRFNDIEWKPPLWVKHLFPRLMSGVCFRCRLAHSPPADSGRVGLRTTDRRRQAGRQCSCKMCCCGDRTNRRRETKDQLPFRWTDTRWWVRWGLLEFLQRVCCSVFCILPMQFIDRSVCLSFCSTQT